MKFVKVTALAAAMAASFGAQAELTALEDEALEAVTGQQGITIEQTLNSMDIYYYDGDGFDANSNDTLDAGDQNGGAIKIGGLQTVSVHDTTGAVTTGDVGLVMEIDVVDNTAATASLSGGAIRINQVINSSTAGASGVLKVGSIQVGGSGALEAANTDANFTAAFANIVDTDTVTAGNQAAASIGSVYVNMGSGMTMYVYGH